MDRIAKFRSWCAAIGYRFAGAADERLQQIGNRLMTFGRGLTDEVRVSEARLLLQEAHGRVAVVSWPSRTVERRSFWSGHTYTVEVPGHPVTTVAIEDGLAICRGR